MKYLLIVLIFAVCYLVTTTEAIPCKSSSECRDDECCVRMVAYKFCRKRGKKDDKCFMDNAEENDVYRFRCTCQEGLECREESISKPERRSVYREGYCKNPNSD